jgi:RND superfamily putative drug exporter
MSEMGGAGVFATLARFSLRFRRGVLIGAALFTVAAAVFGSTVTRHLSEGGLDAPSEESVLAAQVLQNQFHTGDFNFVLLLTARQGTVSDPAVTAAGEELTARLAHQRYVANVSSYWSLGEIPAMASRRGTQALIVGRIVGNEDQLIDREPAVADAFKTVPAAVRVQIGGYAPSYNEIERLVEKGLIAAELIAIPFTVILLLLIYGSLVAALLPVGVGAMAVVGTLLTLRIFTLFTSVSVFAVNLTTAVGLGLAIDYSLFIVTRYREELAKGRSSEEAVAQTVASAGRTVAGSSLTFVGAMAAMAMFPIPYLRSFAYAGVAVALLAGVAAVVVLPSLLSVLGSRVNALAVRRSSLTPRDEGFWSATARRVMRRPALVALGCLALLALLASPFFGLKLGSFDDRVLPPGDSVRHVDDLVVNSIGVGQTQQIDVVIPYLFESAGSPARLQVIGQYATQLSRVKGVGYVAAATGVYVKGLHLGAPAAYLSQFDNARGTWLSVVPSSNTLDDGGRQLVDTIRGSPAPGPILVGGSPAEFVDSTALIVHALPLVLVVVGALSFLVLFIMFKSPLIALKALVLSALSLAAMFGAMVWVFQDGHFASLLDFTPTGNLSATTPILMFCVAFGLSTDYEVFLISRIKERHDAGCDNETAIAQGLQRTGRIVTAAALLMSVVFTGQLASGVSSVKLFGVGVSVAVLMDAFLVRGLLVPALMKLAGQANWWVPKWFLTWDTNRAPAPAFSGLSMTDATGTAFDRPYAPERASVPALAMESVTSQV